MRRAKTNVNRSDGFLLSRRLRWFHPKAWRKFFSSRTHQGFSDINFGVEFFAPDTTRFFSRAFGSFRFFSVAIDQKSTFEAKKDPNADLRTLMYLRQHLMLKKDTKGMIARPMWNSQLFFKKWQILSKLFFDQVYFLWTSFENYLNNFSEQRGTSAFAIFLICPRCGFWKKLKMTFRIWVLVSLEFGKNWKWHSKYECWFHSKWSKMKKSIESFNFFLNKLQKYLRFLHVGSLLLMRSLTRTWIWSVGSSTFERRKRSDIIRRKKKHSHG
jgi:hypothetical protein